MIEKAYVRSPGVMREIDTGPVPRRESVFLLFFACCSGVLISLHMTLPLLSRLAILVSSRTSCRTCISTPNWALKLAVFLSFKSSCWWPNLFLCPLTQLLTSDISILKILSCFTLSSNFLCSVPSSSSSTLLIMLGFLHSLLASLSLYVCILCILL